MVSSARANTAREDVRRCTRRRDCQGLPLVVTSLGDKQALLISDAKARRVHKDLMRLRGRSWDAAPPIFYPSHADLKDPKSRALLFYVPAVGYVSRGEPY